MTSLNKLNLTCNSSVSITVRYLARTHGKQNQCSKMLFFFCNYKLVDGDTTYQEQQTFDKLTLLSRTLTTIR